MLTDVVPIRHKNCFTLNRAGQVGKQSREWDDAEGFLVQLHYTHTQRARDPPWVMHTIKV